MLIAGCDDQMIADLITARRQRPHTDKPKWQDEKKGILRADYYRKTIAKAKTWTVKAQAQQRLAGRFGGGDSGSWVVDATPTGGAAASPPDDLKAGRERKETLDDIPKKHYSSKVTNYDKRHVALEELILPTDAPYVGSAHASASASVQSGTAATQLPPAGGPEGSVLGERADGNAEQEESFEAIRVGR